MRKVNTEKAPAAVGPYSQATVSKGLVYTSGQIPLDPAEGKIVGEDITAQRTRQSEIFPKSSKLQAQISKA